jgi:hypothetical protein
VFFLIKDPNRFLFAGAGHADDRAAAEDLISLAGLALRFRTPGFGRVLGTI